MELEERSLAFGLARNSTKANLPLLIAGEGPFEGLDNITDYVKYSVALGER